MLAKYIEKSMFFSYHDERNYIYISIENIILKKHTYLNKISKLPIKSKLIYNLHL